MTNFMVIWEQYDKDTWCAEWAELNRLALVKQTEPDHWTCLVGTVEEMEWHTNSRTLAGAKALCMRYMILVNNCDDIERVRKISYTL